MQTSQKTRLGLTTLAALGLAATTALTASAAVTVYTDRNAFNSALGAATTFTNTFSSPSNGDNASVPYSGNGLSYTAVGLGPSTDTNPNDVFVDGNTITPYNSNADVLFNSTSNNIYAFGGDFYATTDGETVDPGQTIFVNLSDGTQYTFTSGADASDASAFRGFISTTPLTYAAELPPEPTVGDFATVDNLTVAGQNPTVPEPSSVAAFAFTGLFAAGLMLKARKRQSTM